MKRCTCHRAAVKAELDAYEKLMAQWGLQATPAVIWLVAAGFVQMALGSRRRFG